jgi:putative ABC transport system substrate-binding protein
MKILVLLIGSILASIHFANAQQLKNVPRIGYLSGGPLSAARTDPFRQGLRELGYIEGKNIILEWRSADGKRDRTPALAAELLRLKVKVIITTGSADTA